MVSWILKLLSPAMAIVLNNKRLIIELFLGILLACSVCVGIFLHRQNKSLSESLQTANNNIESYGNIVNQMTTKNNTLQLTVDQLLSSNDSLILKMNTIAEENNIKLSNISTAATQTQSLHVNGGKGVEVDLLEVLKDTVYNDSISYNDLTTVYYTIGKDTVNIALDILNTQYLYTYKTKEWKNKKSFFKRLFTFDFKKVWKYKYEIHNTNDLLNTSDVRVIEITD